MLKKIQYFPPPKNPEIRLKPEVAHPWSHDPSRSGVGKGQPHYLKTRHPGTLYLSWAGTRLSQRLDKES